MTKLFRRFQAKLRKFSVVANCYALAEFLCIFNSLQRSDGLQHFQSEHGGFDRVVLAKSLGRSVTSQSKTFVHESFSKFGTKLVLSESDVHGSYCKLQVASFSKFWQFQQLPTGDRI